MDNRGLPPQTSNFYCLPGRAGGTPMGINLTESNYLAHLLPRHDAASLR